MNKRNLIFIGSRRKRFYFKFDGRIYSSVFCRGEPGEQICVNTTRLLNDLVNKIYPSLLGPPEWVTTPTTSWWRWQWVSQFKEKKHGFTNYLSARILQKCWSTRIVNYNTKYTSFSRQVICVISERRTSLKPSEFHANFRLRSIQFDAHSIANFLAAMASASRTAFFRSFDASPENL